MRKEFIGWIVLLASQSLADSLSGAPLPAPPGLFKDLTDETLNGAVLIQGTQLFVDDWLIDEMRGTRKVLNQPVKHPANPLLIRDKPWEQSSPGYGTVIYDRDERLFKMFYQMWRETEGTLTGTLGYATSPDGIHWEKPTINATSGTNLVAHPPIQGFQCPGVFKDDRDPDPERQYKMLYSANPDGTAATWMTSAAFSPDGLHWRTAEELPLIPFSDTQVCPFWDFRRGRYVAILRFGPPNTRIISRIESDDFLHWSPKVTILRRTNLDAPLATQFYQMAPLPYAGVYFGLIAAYHGETLLPLPADKPWTDRKNLHLAFSRNSVTWSRVIATGAIPDSQLREDRDWKQTALDAAFLPYGEKDKDWDWGTISPYFTPEPIVVGDELWIYYMGQNKRNWWNYMGNPPKLDPDAEPADTGVGLATIRLDGFVSVDADDEGTMTTRPFVFLGDTLTINANAEGGSVLVEALDANGAVIEGFSKADCRPITTNSIRHVHSWTGQDDSHLLQARPIRLRFHLQKAKLFSFTPGIQHSHYVPSYD